MRVGFCAMQELLEENKRAYAAGTLTADDVRPSQKFFELLAKEARSPHYGGQAREFVANLLIRAEEAGLYQP